MALEIVYEELVKDFRIEGNRLFRLSNRGSGREKEVVIKDNNNGYCRIAWRNKAYKSHRLMYCLYNECDVDVELIIDHKDGDKINNSKENLTLGTSRENNQNRHTHRNGKLPGCSFDKANNKWRTHIEIDKKKINLGRFDSEIEAHEVYNTACTMLDKTIKEIQEHFGIKTKDKCTSKYKGVTFHKANNKWLAQSTINGKRIHLGYFNTEGEAYNAVIKNRTL